MKILILGRVGTGKKNLKTALTEIYDWHFAQTLNAKDAGENCICWKEPDGAEKAIRKSELCTSEACIVSPEGAKAILAQMPEELFRILYMQPGDETQRREIAARNAGEETPEKAVKTFEAAKQAEDEAFNAFEKLLAGSNFTANCIAFMTIRNSYEQKETESLAIQLEMDRRLYRNVNAITQQLIETGMLEHDEQMNPIVRSTNEDGKPSAPKALKQAVLSEYIVQNPETLMGILRRWLCLPETNLVEMIRSQQKEENHE